MAMQCWHKCKRVEPSIVWSWLLSWLKIINIPFWRKNNYQKKEMDKRMKINGEFIIVMKFEDQYFVNRLIVRIEYIVLCVFLKEITGNVYRILSKLLISPPSIIINKCTWSCEKKRKGKKANANIKLPHQFREVQLMNNGINFHLNKLREQLNSKGKAIQLLRHL